MRLASTVVLLGTLGTVACQQIYDIVCVEDTYCRLNLHSRLGLSRKVANDMEQANALHLFPAHSGSDQFRDSRRHRQCGYSR